MTKVAILVVALCLTQAATAATGQQRTYTTLYLTTSATVAISAPPASTAGMFSVWVGAQDLLSGSWIQAGVLVDGGGQPCEYVETMDAPTQTHTLLCLQTVAYGQQVKVRVSDSRRHGWVAWINGVPVAQQTLGQETDWYATTESYRGERASFVLDPASHVRLLAW